MAGTNGLLNKYLLNNGIYEITLQTVSIITLSVTMVTASDTQYLVVFCVIHLCHQMQAP